MPERETAEPADLVGDQDLADIEAQLQELASRLRAPAADDETRLQVDTEAASATEVDQDAVAALPAMAPAGERPRSRLPWEGPKGVRNQGQLGGALVRDGIITEHQLEEALEVQRERRGRLGETLIELGFVSKTDFAHMLATHLGVPFVDLESYPPDPLVASLIHEDVARRHHALPIARWNDQVVVAIANPNDVFALDDLRVRIGQPVMPVMCERDQLADAIAHAYVRSEVETSLDDAASDYSDIEDDVTSDTDDVNDGPIIRFVHALLQRAVEDGASDMHIQPSASVARVRLRIDGVLHDVSEAPIQMLRAVVNRLKVLSGLDIAQRRLPQDGRFTVTVSGRPVDVRVATTPTTLGEAVVLRLLDPRRGVLDIAGLGLRAHELARLEPAFRASQGSLFVCGPTGSGKTSTLYAILSEINTADRSLSSVEDPVEYRLDGVKQIQIHTQSGLTFPRALRSLMRADPDVILVGEVRDAETARIAADASITGHLVFSTLHATSAATAPLRLIDMGVEPYLVGSSLTCVVAQRLVRCLCENCAELDPEPDLGLLRAYGADEVLLERARIRRSVGCGACHSTGYAGRRAVYEIMPVSEEIARLIVTRASAGDVERVAVDQGMETLRRAGARLVAEGALSVEELVRAIS